MSTENVKRKVRTQRAKASTSANKSEFRARKAASRAKHMIKDPMDSGLADRGRGKAKRLLGNAKQLFGDFIGDEQLTAEGILQRAEGRRDEFVGQVKEWVEEVIAAIRAALDMILGKFNEVRGAARA